MAQLPPSSGYNDALLDPVPSGTQERQRDVERCDTNTPEFLLDQFSFGLDSQFLDPTMESQPQPTGCSPTAASTTNVVPNWGELMGVSRILPVDDLCEVNYNPFPTVAQPELRAPGSQRSSMTLPAEDGSPAFDCQPVQQGQWPLGMLPVPLDTRSVTIRSDRTVGASPMTLTLSTSSSSIDHNRSGSVEGGGLIFVSHGQPEPKSNEKKRGVIDLQGSDVKEKTIKYSEDGRVQGLEMVMGTPNHKTKGPSSLEAKRAAANCRKKGGACEGCQRRKTTSTTAEFEQSSKMIRLCQLPGEELEVHVCQFEPQEDDKVHLRERDEDGREHVLEMPPYCLARVEQIKKNMEQYIQQTRDKYLETLRGGAEITRLVTETAMEYARQRRGTMTEMALNMWAYSRVIEKQWKICGDDTLGVSEPTDPKSPWYGFVPVTPLMDVQLDQIVIQQMLNPLRMKLLAKFDATIRDSKPEEWFDCYLTIFILLNHVEAASVHGHNIAKAWGSNTLRSIQKQRYSDMTLAEGWFHAAKILLSRFHFISNGSAPFWLNWDTKIKQCHQLDTQQKIFIRRTQELMKGKDTQLEELRAKHRYEQDLYWTHQLFERKWKPGVPHIVEEYRGSREAQSEKGQCSFAVDDTEDRVSKILIKETSQVQHIVNLPMNKIDLPLRQYVTLICC
ncbi:hypothetical protein FALBO_4582 [Fusarium albosuccineum]|uniref:Uncharacterized protein n=1 Tax=Fusarium albosuccineum TaxID=1237068 RepID=A0A8H4PKQ7_9HYPO|nr:hypothetical protein FALBO_4582 [Fusarium albosuccineum]